MCAWLMAAGGPIMCLPHMLGAAKGNDENPLGAEVFTITEKQAKQRQDGSWYMETVKVEKSALA